MEGRQRVSRRGNRGGTEGGIEGKQRLNRETQRKINMGRDE